MEAAELGGDSIGIRQENGVATLTMCGSAAGNALGGAFWRRLPEVLAALGIDEDLGAIVLTGPEGIFSSGLDLRWYVTSYSRIMREDGGSQVSRSALLKQEQYLQDAVQALASCPLPVIAALDGTCSGIAMELAVACDFRLASSTARFSLPEVGLGFIPDLGILSRLPRLVGDGWARQLALTGDEIDAASAVQIGLVNAVYPDGAQLRAAAAATAARIAGHPRAAVQGTRDLLERSAHTSLNQSLREGALSTAALMPTDLADHLRPAIAAASASEASDSGGEG